MDSGHAKCEGCADAMPFYELHVSDISQISWHGHSHKVGGGEAVDLEMLGVPQSQLCATSDDQAGAALVPRHVLMEDEQVSWLVVDRVALFGHRQLGQHPAQQSALFA
jgi:hypothetical protein